MLVYRTTLHTYMYEIAHNIHTFLFLNACVKVFTCVHSQRTSFRPATAQSLMSFQWSGFVYFL